MGEHRHRAAPASCRTPLLAGLTAAAWLCAGLAVPAFAEPPPRHSAAAAPTDGERFCASIADAAADARFAWQADALKDLQGEIDARIAALEAKRAEYEEWLTRRAEFLAKAEEGVVGIYAKMRPDAAAQQLSRMDEGAASAIIAKLNTRVASAILNEMEPARGARLTNAITGSPTPPDEDDQS